MALKIGISGLRGTIIGGEPGLTPDVALRWARAFATTVQGKAGRGASIALGRDGRRSSPTLADLVRAALQASGARVVDLGLTLT
ncbi:MAG TPA: phosphoglucosamine mutase, partial [Chloroflexi bacterium]|nr:phosphoglucosamine mutase [Chloroflexota bacterium]